ncbi:MAG TPA: flagellar hook-length control protein FliK [Burkholderiaceae bacterium]|nr:flagellar hook-length control protein FliK [Burkholderiaceae bacterium]
MAAPMLVAFLNLPQQAPQSVAAVASGVPPLATAALDAVRVTKAPLASAPAQIQPAMLPSAQPVNAGASELSLMPRAATTEMTSQPGVGRAPTPASIPIAADMPEPLRERGGVSVAPAPVWSTPIVNAGDAALPSVRLTGPSSQWQQPLRQALGEQLQVQVERGSEQAVIRLSPPMLGRIEISIRHEAGTLQVHMNASNSEVLRQLQGIGDSLRQDLSQRHQYSDVAVVVSGQPRHGEGDGNGRQRHEAEPREQQPGQALADADQGSGAFALLTDSE